MLIATWAAIAVVASATLVLLGVSNDPVDHLHDSATGDIDVTAAVGSFVAWSLPIFVVGTAASVAIGALARRIAARRSRVE